MKKVFLLICLLSVVLFASVPASAQKKSKNGAVIYNDYSIPLPEGKTLKDVAITANDLKLTDKYLDLYPEGFVDADQSTLRAMYEYYKDDPTGQSEWKSLQGKAVKAISNWDLKALINKRYVYSIEQLKFLAIVYVYTGNELISDFIRGHFRKIAALPIDFWIHAELRKLYPEKPQGYLETSYINSGLSIAIPAVRRNMTEEEFKAINDAYYNKGYICGLNFLDAHTENLMGNFTAVVSNGVLYAAKYFKDEAGFRKGMKHLKMYLDQCILPDGSNFEGYGYFDYPAGLAFKSCLVMTLDQIQETFADCSLSGAMKWRLAGMLFGDDNGHPSEFRITYGDNPSKKHAWKSVDMTTWLCKLVCNDGLAAWILQHWKQQYNGNVMKLAAKFGNPDIKATAPQDAGIPLMTTYNSGDCYIRSGWSDDEVVLGLKQINGNKAKQLYQHARPEINSINLGAFGDYIICNAASASYRSPIRFEHDIRSWRANIITVDGKDQLFPNTTAKKNGTYGFPDARIIRKESLPDGGYILSNEAKDAYFTPMKQATRTIRYIPSGRFFIVKDIMIPEDGAPHRFDHRLFMFNWDNETKIEKRGNLMVVSRPKSELYIALQSSTDLSLEFKDAYIHGLSGRDYDPDGPQQGKLGSAIGMQWSCESPQLEVTTILYPKHPGERAPKIKFNKDKVTVDGKSYDLNEL